MPVYSASKFAVLGLSESLRAELVRHGVGVTAIHPGIIATALVANSIMEGKISDPAVHGKAVKFYEYGNYTPGGVADVVVKAVRRDTAVPPVLPEARAMCWMKRFAPGFACRFPGREVTFLK
jgi:NAD(P)-dependent dehydrogenase (short-subunit alcohol dehydrogenase family)